MKAVKNQGKEAVVEVIEPAGETTYDLIGLSVEQMAGICILIGRSSGSANGLYELYDKVHVALGGPCMGAVESSDIIQEGRLSLSREVVSRIVSQVR